MGLFIAAFSSIKELIQASLNGQCAYDPGSLIFHITIVVTSRSLQGETNGPIFLSNLTIYKLTPINEIEESLLKALEGSTQRRPH